MCGKSQQNSSGRTQKKRYNFEIKRLLEIKINTKSNAILIENAKHQDQNVGIILLKCFIPKI